MTEPHGEAGETLVEVLVAMVVIGIAVTAILGALAIAVDSSSLARNQARVQSTLRSWAEQVTATRDGGATGGYRYTPCAGPGDFPAPAELPSGFTTQVSQVQYWNGTAWSGACATDRGVQRVTLTVSAPGAAYSGVTQSLNVVVRRPCVTAAAC